MIQEWYAKATQHLSTQEKRDLYKRLIREEFNELMQEDSHTPEEFHELCDLIWVCLLYAFSQGYDLESGMDRLLIANQTKFQDKHGLPVMNFDDSGKLLKGNGYIPPKFEDLVK